MKTTVIFHSADFDGLFCREIARKFLPEAELIGWNFGDTPLDATEVNQRLYIMDLPMDKPFGLDFVTATEVSPANVRDAVGLAYRDVVWIDHHKSSIESHPKDISGYRIDGVAACRLAWQWLAAFGRFEAQSTIEAHSQEGMAWFMAHYPLPKKSDFIDRNVEEPLAVRLAGEYDVAGPDANDEALNFQFGLRSWELTDQNWADLLVHPYDGNGLTGTLIERGRAVRGYLEKADAMAAQSAFPMEFDGLLFLAINAYRGNSKAMQIAAANGGADAVMAFAYRGKKWTVSMYGIPGKDIDLSAIAKAHGGGGHARAAGFECDKLPWLC